MTLVVVYRVVGVHIDENGVLHEPFPLIPLAWICGLIGLGLVAIAVWCRR